MALTVGSLFAGIGGFDLGFERAGFQVKWQVEIDPFCQRVLAKHWPDVRRYGDIREVHQSGLCGAGAVCAGCLEPVDVLCGGFPCQDISPAGKRAGIRGERSGLWSEYARLIRELRPRYVVVENSSNLLAAGYGADVVLGDLAASRYDAEWDCLPARAFGAPHERERVWIVAYPGSSEWRPRHSCGRADDRANGDGAQSEDWRGAQGTGVAQERARAVSDTDREGWQRSRLSIPREQGTDRADAQRPCAHDADAHQARKPVVFGREAIPGFSRVGPAYGPTWWSTEPALVRVVHGVSEGLVRRRERHSAQIGALGNAVVPQITEWIARRIADAEGLAA